MTPEVQHALSVKYTARAVSIAFLEEKICLFEVRGSHREILGLFSAAEELITWLRQDFYAAQKRISEYRERPADPLASLPVDDFLKDFKL